MPTNPYALPKLQHSDVAEVIIDIGLNRIKKAASKTGLGTIVFNYYRVHFKVLESVLLTAQRYKESKEHLARIDKELSSFNKAVRKELQKVPQHPKRPTITWNPDLDADSNAQMVKQWLEASTKHYERKKALLAQYRTACSIIYEDLENTKTRLESVLADYNNARKKLRARLQRELSSNLYKKHENWRVVTAHLHGQQTPESELSGLIGHVERLMDSYKKQSKQARVR